MNRPLYYQQQVVNKLLSSKFIYSQTLSSTPIKKLIIKGTVKTKNQEVGATTVNILFGRRPSFSRALRPRENEYRLVHLTLTSPTKRIANDLDSLATTILPFQLENRTFQITTKKSAETSWAIEGCTPATPLNPILFPYPITDEEFNLTILIIHEKTSLASLTFYINLFQVPLTVA